MAGPRRPSHRGRGPERGVRVRIGTELVRQLVDGQFPEWAALPLVAVEPGGSDHVIHRLGRELAVRLPRRAAVAERFATEYHWLPRLAPHLPLAVPEPVRAGRPGFGYPWPWAVFRWLDGEQATVEVLGDSAAAAVELAGFLEALQRFPAEGVSGDLSHGSLADRDRETRASIARFGEAGEVFDAPAATALWDAALGAPGWDRPPVWFHGDFHTGNLLTVDGRLSAVIDFGGLGLGDPARDLMVAFTLLSPGSRTVFRAALGVDEATWTRGRGWALATGLNAYAAYGAVDAGVAAQTVRQIRQALIG
ncbi:aminoglycoside phosphotransferase family protein [Streptomyces sp. NPDC059917]|uniref:aminoglycoside phosphotransferase family protein n=1 Tax=Streptomyces sp. NPDC059917 TaxID=3347002 RepID=UPI00364CBF8D